jgi:TolB-like protein/Flp pilus assembly protein TadD
MSAIRQLAAIMFADIAGYTALMQQNESVALQLRDKLKRKLDEETRRHQGRILEFRGDGALCSFNSTTEAVLAAIALQQEMQTEPLVPVRIGMHTGDVILDNDTIFGDGVNIASRIESFAVPGSIFISDKVFDDIKNQKEIRAVSLGRFAFKNVEEEMEIFAISNPGIKIPERRGLQGKGEIVRSHCDCVLVLPFINMSNDPGQEYFSDGLTEELISKLSSLKELKVISRTTSMKYKGTQKDIRTIHEETDASYIVEGSVRTQGKMLRITAQFVDAVRDIHIWADSYRGNLDDIFDIQEQVSVKIVEALRLRISGEEKNTLRKRYTENPEAYQLYLQGRFFWNKRTELGLKTAIKHFERALEKDPGYALAWAGIADSYSLMGEYTHLYRRDLYESQMKAIHKALELDPELAEAHISLAISLMLNDWDWANAGKEFRRGIELNPNYATGHHWYAEYLLFTGHAAEAFQEIDIAIELDPVSQGILKDKGIFLYYDRQYDEAIRIAMKAKELAPEFAPVYRLLSLAYAGKGMFEDALRENNKWGEITGNQIKTEIALAHIYAAMGRRDDALGIMNKAGLEERLSSNDYRSVAIVFATLNDRDKTFEWLQKSLQKHEESLCSLIVDPKFDMVKDDPRFQQILEKIYRET